MSVPGVSEKRSKPNSARAEKQSAPNVRHYAAVSDSPFLKHILLACSRGPTRLFRCNRGTGWTGKVERVARPTTVTMGPSDVLIRGARPLHAGLNDGNGDLIGWHSIVVTPDMVGRRVAVFASLEGKEGNGRMSAEQRVWRDQVRAAGGIAEEVRSVEDAQAAFDAGLDVAPADRSSETVKT